MVGNDGFDSTGTMWLMLDDGWSFLFFYCSISHTRTFALDVVLVSEGNLTSLTGKNQ